MEGVRNSLGAALFLYSTPSSILHIVICLQYPFSNPLPPQALVSYTVKAQILFLVSSLKPPCLLYFLFCSIVICSTSCLVILFPPPRTLVKLYFLKPRNILL